MIYRIPLRPASLSVPRRRSQVVRQRSAKPPPPVRIWAAPLRATTTYGPSFRGPVLVGKVWGRLEHSPRGRGGDSALKRPPLIDVMRLGSYVSFISRVQEQPPGNRLTPRGLSVYRVGVPARRPLMKLKRNTTKATTSNRCINPPATWNTPQPRSHATRRIPASQIIHASSNWMGRSNQSGQRLSLPYSTLSLLPRLVGDAVHAAPVSHSIPLGRVPPNRDPAYPPSTQGGLGKTYPERTPKTAALHRARLKLV